jgi:hypothetical protein
MRAGEPDNPGALPRCNRSLTFCRRLPVTVLADDVGLGKTFSAGLIASELIARGRIFERADVARARRRYLGLTWDGTFLCGTELKHLESFDFRKYSELVDECGGNRR